VGLEWVHKNYVFRCVRRTAKSDY